MCYGYIIVPSNQRDVLFSHSFYLQGNKLNLYDSIENEINAQALRTMKQSHKIFIGGLPPEATKFSLSNFFKRYGEIEYSIVMTHKVTYKSRGFGFVLFKNKISVDNALGDTWNHYILGKWVECKKANSKEECTRREESDSSDILSKIPFTSRPNPLDNIVYDCSVCDKKMDDYIKFKFNNEGERIIL